jgi:signal transduction histidine kinase
VRSRPWQSIRNRLVLLGFVAIYVPALLVFGVAVVTEVETNGPATTHSETVRITWTVLALAPVAAALAWWWAGRAVRPIDRVRAVAEDIEATDLSRRIGLDRGPAELVSLAASFDAMLERLEQAAETQRQLIEETSHDLRTPLSVLMTGADVLLAHPNPTIEVYRQGLERSRSAAARLQATVDALLVDARGRARTIDRQPAELVGLVRSVVEEFAATALARGIELPTTGPPAAECRVDRPTVHRAVSNLVDNAIRHAPAGTAVEVHVEATASEVAVVVTDHGAGIPPAEQGRIFQRFWRSRHDVEGTGLGLPIANQVSLAHGGQLTVTSPGPAGDGCVFRLSLRR